MTTNKRLFNLLLSPADARRLGARAKEAGLTKSELVRRLIAGQESTISTPFEKAMGLWGEIFARKVQLVGRLPQLTPHEMSVLSSVAANDQDTLRAWFPDKSSAAVEQAADVLLGRIPRELAIDISFPGQPQETIAAAGEEK